MMGFQLPKSVRRCPFYYGWVIVVVAAVAMSATLPGRTHGLGLITEPLLKDLVIERTRFAQINMLASLLGATFCLPVGYFLDRFGTRKVMAIVVACLALSVLGMARATGPVSLFLTLVLIRGFGQSALSVVSIAAVGKWFRRRLGVAMGVYSVLLTIGFIGPILWLGDLVQKNGWRSAWAELGWVLLLGVFPAGWILQRNAPEELGQTLDAEPDKQNSPSSNVADFSLRQALSTPAFWLFAAGTAIYNLVWSGVTLFNESILQQRGFESGAAVQVMAVLTVTGLPASLIAGWLTRRERLGNLLGISMMILTLSLSLLPSMSAKVHLWIYASAMGFAGGLVMVVFFSAWGQFFGQRELGRIQGAAQVISVLASSLGPELLAECQKLLNSYDAIFYALAGITGTIGVVAMWVPLPKPIGVAEVYDETRQAIANCAVPAIQEI